MAGPEVDIYVTKCEFDMHKIEIEELHKRHNEMYEKNMEAIAKLTESTQGVVDAWTTANNLHKFTKWLSGFAIVGIVITWLIDILGI